MNLRILDMSIEATALAVILSQPDISSARAGFMLIFANTIYINVNFFLTHLREFEVKGVSLERTAEYRVIEKEEGQAVDLDKPEQEEETESDQYKGWPNRGSIKVSELQASYGVDLPIILHNLSFIVEGGQRIGIVGASGGGKSTLAKAFFSFVDITSGMITIDGEGMSLQGKS